MSFIFSTFIHSIIIRLCPLSSKKEVSFVLYNMVSNGTTYTYVDGLHITSIIVLMKNGVKSLSSSCFFFHHGRLSSSPLVLLMPSQYTPVSSRKLGLVVVPEKKECHDEVWLLP